MGYVMQRMSRDYTEVILIRVSPELNAQVRQICSGGPRRSVSEFIRQAIRTQIRLEKRGQVVQAPAAEGETPCETMKP